MKLFALLVLLAACSTTEGGFPTDRVLTAADAGIVELHTGDRFSVVLDADPKSGFEWHALIANDALLIRQGEPVLAGGIETFTYRIAGPGSTLLQFEYKHPSEDLPTAKVVTYDVIVR